MAKSLIGKIVDLARVPSLPQASQYNARGGMLRGGGTADRFTMLQQMGGQGTLYGIVQLLSTGVSAHEWHLYRKNQDNRRRYGPSEADQTPRTEVFQHQALKLWDMPNDFYTGQDFREVGWQFMELVAEWYWVIDRGPSGTGVPLEMWPVRPDRMEPIPDRDKYLVGWVYTGPNGEQVPLLDSEVIQLRYPDPSDPYRGLSAVQSILADIDAARYTAEWSRNFFMNSATPGGIVQFSKRLSDEEFDEFVLRWREQHQGVARAHHVGVLEQGAMWIPNTYSMREMQFQELRTLSREVIREAYRIHSSMLGMSEDVNRANAQTAEDVHVQWHEVPRLVRMRTVLNKKFLPMFGATGTNVEFDFEDPTRTDMIEVSQTNLNKANAAAVLVKAGYNMADVLDAVGLPPMKESATPLPPPAPRPALPPGAAPPGAPQPGDEAALAAISREIRDAFRERRRGGLIEPDYEAFAAMLMSELPHHNGHRKELV